MGGKAVVEEAQGVDGSTGDDGGVAVEDAVVVLDGHIDVAGEVVLHVLHVDGVVVAYDVVGATFLTCLLALHGDVACQRVAGKRVVEVEVVESVLRLVILACVVHHRFHEGHLLAGGVVEHGLNHESGVVREHLAGHTHTGLHMEIVASDLDVGWLGQNLVGNALLRDGHLLERDTLLFEHHAQSRLALHVHFLGLHTHHGETQTGIGTHVDGKGSVDIGHGKHTACGGVGNVDTDTG